MKPYESKAGYKSVLLSAFLLRIPVASLRRFASLQHQLMIRRKIYVLEKLRFEKLTNSGEAQQKILVIEVEKTDCTAPLTTPGSLKASVLLALEASPGNGRPAGDARRNCST